MTGLPLMFAGGIFDLRRISEYHGKADPYF